MTVQGEKIRAASSRLFNREWLEHKGLAAHAIAPPHRAPITLEKALVA